MATVPVMDNWVDGNVVNAAMLNEDLRDAINFLLNGKPYAKLRRAAAFSHNSSGNWLAMPWDTEVDDNDSGHSTVSNVSRYTAQTAGRFLLGGGNSFDSNATGLRGIRWTKNGAVDNALGCDNMAASYSGTHRTVAPTTQVVLSVGDYVEMEVFQSSGGNVGTSTASGSQPYMIVAYLSTT